MLKVESIGEEFKKALDEKLKGKVLLVSRRALLIDLNGKIFEILSSKMPRSTISAIISKNGLDDLPLAVGDPVDCKKNILLNGVELDLDRAEVWIWDLNKADFNLYKDDWAKAGGWIKNILNAHRSVLLEGIKDPLLRAAMERIDRVFSLCERSYERDDINWICDILDLVGLGPGLTPAGDDALAGFLVGSYYFVPHDSQLFGFLNLLRDKIGNIVTTAYSKKLLSLAANGISNEYVKMLILGIADQNYYSVMLNAKKILELGATSGYFYLLGFMRGLGMAAV